MKHILLLALILVLPIQVFAEIPPQWIDAKYCGPPARDANGDIIRSSTAIKYFKQQNPCPSTGLTFGPCPGWHIDHVRSLAACGCDSVSNSQWLPEILKAGPGTLPKDRWERRAYKCHGTDIEITPMPDSQRLRLDVAPR